MKVEYPNNFETLIRISKKQKQWIQENKKRFNCKTDASFLDMIINNYKINI